MLRPNEMGNTVVVVVFLIFATHHFLKCFSPSVFFLHFWQYCGSHPNSNPKAFLTLNLPFITTSGSAQAGPSTSLSSPCPSCYCPGRLWWGGQHSILTASPFTTASHTLCWRAKLHPSNPISTLAKTNLSKAKKHSPLLRKCSPRCLATYSRPPIAWHISLPLHLYFPPRLGSLWRGGLPPSHEMLRVDVPHFPDSSSW